jgi:hypothetical protein
MATSTTTDTTIKRHRFPRRLGRFINLEGGLYGTLDLLALTSSLLELQTGEDFVRFDRVQAKNLRDTIDTFLAFEGGAPEARLDAKESATVTLIEESREEFAREKPARSRGRKVTRKSERKSA